MGSRYSVVAPLFQLLSYARYALDADSCCLVLSRTDRNHWERRSAVLLSGRSSVLSPP
jgi:hypothetical protein